MTDKRFSSLPPRTKPLPRGKRVKKRNATRRTSEFARCYHSRERVRFVKAMPCVVCSSLSIFFAIGTAGESDNAHTVGEGMGRKAGYETIVPLCREHHRRYDQHIAPLDNEEIRAKIIALAPRIEAAWLHAHGQPFHDAPE